MTIEPITKAATGWPTCHLFDVCIDAVTLEQVVEAADQAIANRRRLLIGVVNAAKLVNMRKDHGLRRAVLGADMILADGMSIVWASRLLGRPLPQRVAGIDVMTALLKLGDERGSRVFLLGATEQVLSRVRKIVIAQYPGLALVGSRDGYFSDEEQPSVVREIADARPDILFVAMGSPKKEKFLAHWATVLNVPVCHGVGGAFDVLAGVTRRAPQRWQKLGMEWAYRLVQEPRRMWKRYLVTNTIFVCMVLRALLGRLRPDRSSASSSRVERAHGS